ncbi:glycogen debranching N-terminal domain-containing protein [Catellatospora sp. TT07R-123]|uniref:amylo-alpha-1,6-glucosidase n=1 Tax=Catellatospora sp. TT07R-123 TaxID=2733863 RepID=UPI001BB4487D|nr:glycogen debranching N-terminal domain-containing protein [Catellatospora sp. TT07R-123]
MTNPAPLNASEPVPHGQGEVTIVEGTTFSICAPNGDMNPGAAQGLFFRDTRIVSCWQLRLDGQPPQPLQVVDRDAFAARFMLRRPPAPGHADSSLLVVRERIVGQGMREVITLQNVGYEPTMITLDLRVETDFADLFAVKEGQMVPSVTHATATGVNLVFSRSDNSRGLLVHATGEPTSSHNGLSWQAVIPGRGRWQTEIEVHPVVESRRIEPRFRDHLAAEDADDGSWRRQVSAIRVQHDGMSLVLRRSVRDLDALRISITDEARQTFVAAGAPWFMTLFGRDSLLTSWMALPLDPGLAVGTLYTLAGLQGRKVDPRTDEEPGRILHELRLGPESASALGGSHYYGTIDAGPLFVALLGEVWRWGAAESDVRALLPAADGVLNWMQVYGDRDGDGFVEYRRATDRGLFNQGWKDSFDGINDAAGRLVEPPVALAEVQGYAYAAWRARAELAEAFGDQACAAACTERADKLRERFAEAFWLPDEGYFAVALDGHKRPMDALTSNPGHCLWTGIVSDEHAAQLVQKFAGADMDSGFGLRTLSERMGAYNPMSYHNGSVWPHDTALCIAGLMRYAHVPGAVELAHRLADGLIAAATAFGGRLPELYCGFPADVYRPPVPYPTSCSPQAWASAAPLLIVRAFLGLDLDVPRRSIVLRPRLPESWGTVTVDRLPFLGAKLRISAKGTEAEIKGLPESSAAESGLVAE